MGSNPINQWELKGVQLLGAKAQRVSAQNKAADAKPVGAAEGLPVPHPNARAVLVRSVGRGLTVATGKQPFCCSRIDLQPPSVLRSVIQGLFLQPCLCGASLPCGASFLCVFGWATSPLHMPPPGTSSSAPAPCRSALSPQLKLEYGYLMEWAVKMFKAYLPFQDVCYFRA